MNQVSLTRKAFVASAALTASCALSSTALADADAPAESAAAQGWLGVEPEEPQPYDVELSCDVVVVGLGLAGVSATRAACEAGASVVAFEKGTDFGLGSKDCCSFGSKLFLERFPEIEPYWRDGAELLVNEISKACSYRNNARILKKWIEINGDNVDWYVSAVPEESLSAGTSENGNTVDSKADCTLYAASWPVPAEYDPYAENLPCLPGSFKMGGSLNKGFLSANLDRAYDAAGEENLQVLRTTRVVRLLREDGRVCGVVAQDARGKTYKVTAARGVVLATGDFMNDEQMVGALLPQILESGYHPNGDNNWYMTKDQDGNSCNTGDGHRMALWAGAKLQDYPCAMSHLVANASSCFGTVPFLMLDRDGRRFMNEDVQGQQCAERVRQLPERRAFQIFDASWPEQMPFMPYGHGKAPNATQEDLDARVEDGTTVVADTLEKLFAAIDIDAQAALTSVQRYNELCDAGVDIDFGKISSRMFALVTPPFYAAQVGRGDDLVTMTGIESDELCHALDAEHAVVPGLFVAGNVQGGRFANIYPETALGVSVAMALSFGREAGANAATGI